MLSFQWFAKLAERWRNWTGDRDLEVAIRQHLSDRGYRGASAQLKAVKLIAIQRPGWIQIYRFEAVAIEQTVESDSSPSPQEKPRSLLLYGLVRDDGRAQSEVETFIHPARRIELFHQWAEGMIKLRGAFASM